MISDNFTPYSALAGGLVIGLAAALLFSLNGKILGNSGIIARALFYFRYKSTWEIFFVFGLFLGALIMRILTQDWVAVEINAGVIQLIIAGFLVGFGTNMGSGCTSGHGICGLARFSKRSLVATLIFMITGILTVFLTHHVIGK